MNRESWAVHRREDGAVLVRVPSKPPADGRPLPDAVFAFRAGDPQFSYWEKQLLSREGRHLSPPPPVGADSARRCEN